MKSDKVIKPAPDASGKICSCWSDTVFNNKSMKFRRFFSASLGLYANLLL